MKQFKMDHEELHSDEIHRLQGVTTPQHMQENDLVATFRRNKFNIYLSKFSFELMFTFLQENSYTSILGVLNQYLNIKGNIKL